MGERSDRALAGFAGTLALAAALVSCDRRRGTDVPQPAGPMNAEQGARYVLALVNHDRAEEGLPEVEWDDTAARAAERHAADMAKNGFTAHWGTDGSVPEQRYSEAGGEHLVWENAACLFDGQTRALDPDARYTALDL